MIFSMLKERVRLYPFFYERVIRSFKKGQIPLLVTARTTFCAAQSSLGISSATGKEFGKRLLGHGPYPGCDHSSRSSTSGCFNRQRPLPVGVRSSLKKGHSVLSGSWLRDDLLDGMTSPSPVRTRNLAKQSRRRPAMSNAMAEQSLKSAHAGIGSAHESTQ
jgi:hypothetical protein